MNGREVVPYRRTTKRVARSPFLPTLGTVRRPRDIVAYGSDALLVNWEPIIDPAVSAGVHAYARALNDHPNVTECVPAYASLLVSFVGISAYALREIIYELEPTADAPEGILHDLPVVYDGPDLAEVGAATGLAAAEIIDLHTSREYLVYQIGFRPGFGFLGPTDERLTVARRSSPRARVAAGSVGLAGRQTGVYPEESPGGWQLIGRCPFPLLAATGSRLLGGDRVRFRPITAQEFVHLENHPPPWPQR